MEITIGKFSRAGDLTSVVDGLAIRHSKIDAGWDKVVQVYDGATWLPQEPVHLKLRVGAPGCTYYLSFCIHEMRDTAGIIFDRSKIGHHAPRV